MAMTAAAVEYMAKVLPVLLASVNSVNTFFGKAQPVSAYFYQRYD